MTSVNYGSCHNTQRTAYQLSRKTVPVFITGALELRDPLLKIADIKRRGAALAFTAIEIRTTRSLGTGEKNDTTGWWFGGTFYGKTKLSTGFLTHVFNNS